MNRLVGLALCVFVLSSGGIAYGHGPSNKSAKSVDFAQNIIDLTNFGKPGAPVRLEHQVPKSIDVGQSVSLELNLDSDTQTGQMAVMLSVNDGIALESSSNHVFQLSPSAIYPLNIEVSGLIPGLHYLNVHIAEFNEVGEALMTRAMAVPVVVGGESQVRRRKHRDYAEDVNGRPMIEMQAVEQRRDKID